jgi:hypothetical protein
MPMPTPILTPARAWLVASPKRAINTNVLGIRIAASFSACVHLR